MAIVGENLPHCRGTGRSEDPYIFNSFDGFIEAINVNGAYVNGDTTGVYEDKTKRFIDMNYVRPEGYTKELGIKCLLLDGKDWTIRNLFLKDVQTGIRCYPYSSDITQIFQNLNILNCYHTYLNIGGTNYPAAFIQSFNDIHGNTKFKVINCKFSVLINQNESTNNHFISNQRDSSFTTFYFDTCSFNVKFFNSCDHFIYNYRSDGIYISYCNFKIRFCKSCSTLLSYDYATHIDNCKFKVIGSNDENTSYITSLIMTSDSQINSCYFYLDIVLRNIDYSSAFRTACIFNKDTRQKNFYNNSIIKNLTTEEILQPELLESYGFPIMIEDDGT